MNAADSTTGGTMTRQALYSVLFILLGLALAPVRIAVMTRVLSEAAYGLFNLLTLTAASIGFIALLGQRQYLIFRLPGKDVLEQGRYAKSALVVTVMSGLLFAVMFWIACQWVPVLRASFGPTLTWVGTLYIALYALAQLGLGYLLATGDVIRYRWHVFLTANLWMLVLLPVLPWISVSLGPLAWLWLAGLLVPLWWVFRRAIRTLGAGRQAPASLTLMKESTRYGVPLISRNIATSLLRLFDRYIILRFMGATQVGLYTVPITLVTYAADTMHFLEFFFPHISKQWQANLLAGKPGCSGEASDHYHAAIRICLLATVPMALGIWLWGDAVVLLLAGPSYASVSFLFAVLVAQVIMIPLSNFIHFAMMLDNRTKIISYTIIGSTGANLALNILLVPKWGLLGAAAAGTASYVLLLLSSLWTSGLWSHLRISAFRLFPLAVSSITVLVGVGVFRAIWGTRLAWELPLAAVLFGLFGHLTRLWSVNEVKALLRRKSRERRPGA